METQLPTIYDCCTFSMRQYFGKQLPSCKKSDQNVEKNRSYGDKSMSLTSPSFKEIMTDRPTNRSTDRQAHRDVMLQIA